MSQYFYDCPSTVGFCQHFTAIRIFFQTKACYAFKNSKGIDVYAASHKEVKDIAVGTGVSGHAGSDSVRESLSIFQGMRICPT